VSNFFLTGFTDGWEQNLPGVSISFTRIHTASMVTTRYDLAAPRIPKEWNNA
jgi:hypothetical protein